MRWCRGSICSVKKQPSAKEVFVEDIESIVTPEVNTDFDYDIFENDTSVDDDNFGIKPEDVEPEFNYDIFENETLNPETLNPGFNVTASNIHLKKTRKKDLIESLDKIRENSDLNPKEKGSLVYDKVEKYFIDSTKNRSNFLLCELLDLIRDELDKYDKKTADLAVQHHKTHKKKYVGERRIGRDSIKWGNWPNNLDVYVKDAVDKKSLSILK